MVFSSIIFLTVFLPIVMIVQWFLPLKQQNLLLLIASILFYAWGEPVYILLMLFSITLNWAAGLLLQHTAANKVKHKAVVVGAVLANLGLLAYFKYFSFFGDIVNSIFNSDAIKIAEIALPLGISFYTFQAMSYVIDLYRGEIKVQKNWFSLALYVSFFPQLIAGPIVRYQTIENELSNRKITINGTAYGIKRFIYGLSKKVLLANVFARTADDIFALSAADMSTPVAWLGVVAYAMQIYYDFSGYSDMAIGLGSMCGFTFPENFNYPYMASSVKDFWRRWHISLSTWFKKYLYIPLGGNRKGAARTLVNLMIVFFCTGLWHGARWQFVAWGLYYGFFLVIERLFLGKLLEKKGMGVIKHIYTLFVVLTAWVLFRAGGMREAIEIMFKMVLPSAGAEAYPLMRFVDGKLIFLLVVGIFSCGPIQRIFKKYGQILYDKNKLHVCEVVCLTGLLVLCVIGVISSTYNPFIYFRF